MSERTPLNDEIIRNVVGRLRKTARTRQIIAYVLVAVTLLMTGVAVLAFLQSRALSGEYAGKTQMSFSFFFLSLDLATESMADLTENPPTDQEIFLRNITDALIRFAAVILAIFMIQHLIAFAWYNIQVATRMGFAADLIELSRGDAEDIKELSKGLGISAVPFGKMPEHGYDKVLGTLGSFVPKFKK